MELDTALFHHHFPKSGERFRRACFHLNQSREWRALLRPAQEQRFPEPDPLAKPLTVSKRYAAGLEMSCPGGAGVKLGP